MNKIKIRNLIPCFCVVILMGCSSNRGLKVSEEPQSVTEPKYVLVIHGGAGSQNKKNISPSKAIAYRNALKKALRIGEEILKLGGSSLDAVQASIQEMESNPLFNAGRGAVSTYEGGHELDASIMNGLTMNAGAVTCVTTIKSPISAARAVMDASPHVFLSGAGAEQFAREQNLEMVPKAYFRKAKEWKNIPNSLPKNGEGGQIFNEEWDKFGTVGAGSIRCPREFSSRNVHRWHEWKTLEQNRRFTGHRCWYICQQQHLCGIMYGAW